MPLISADTLASEQSTCVCALNAETLTNSALQRSCRVK